jgi:hypothetical protein
VAKKRIEENEERKEFEKWKIKIVGCNKPKITSPLSGR